MSTCSKTARRRCAHIRRRTTFSKFAPEKWVAVEEDLQWIVDDLDWSRHFPAIPKKNQRVIRKVSKIERASLKLVEWPEPKKKR